MIHQPVTPSRPAAPAASRVDWARLPRPLAVLLLALGFLLGLAPMRTVPAVAPATAPPDAFSAARAMTHVTALATVPRPAGSPASAAARDYLMGQIRALGLEPQAQSVLVRRHQPGWPAAVLIRVENVLARVPGAAPGGRAVLVSGHYDTVPTSPGASDCAMCAATTLETLRAVVAAAQAGRPLRNDVIFLFSDGEELGVAGAEGFMRHHPWAADVGLSLVFEGLGSDSAPLLYVSGDESGAVVGQALDALDAATRYPLASSFVNDFMWAVAGNTGSDLDAFLDGAPGLGFVYLSLPTLAAYHAATDSVARLDPRSVQGMGDFSLALTRYFGDVPLDELPAAPNMVTFPLWPGAVARYSGAWALPLAGVAAALLLAALVVGWRRGRLRLGGVVAGTLAWPLMALSAIVAVTFVWWLTRLWTPALHNMNAGGWYGGGVYLAAALTLALAVALGWWRLFRRRVAAADLTAGALLWWALLALLTAMALPGMSYLFVWPLLLAAGGWLALGLSGRSSLPATVAAAIVAVWLFAPVFYVMWVYVGRAETMLGLPVGALPVVFATPLLGLLAPVVEWLVGGAQPKGAPAGRVARWLTPAAFVLALALFAAPALLLRPSAARPWSNAVAYRLDADANRAEWLAFTDSRGGRGTRHALDEWTGQFLPDGGQATTVDPWLVAGLDTPYSALSSPATPIALPRTTVSATADAGRVSLDLARPANAWVTELTLRGDAPLTAIAVNGEPLDLGATPPTEFRFTVIGAEPELMLDITTTGTVSGETLDRLLVDLPEVAAAAGLSVAPRPAWMIPAPASDITDAALVHASFVAP